MPIRNTLNSASVWLTGPTMAVLLLTALNAPLTLARTLVESDDTMYSLNAIGFAHIDFAEYEDRAKDIAGASFNEGFQTAKLALHLSSRLGQRITTFLETELTADGEQVSLEVERVIVKYDINNQSQISVGRYHAPVGYWNQYYHHGRWLQVSKDRPVLSEFGKGFLPAHYWGAKYERKILLNNYVIDVDVGLGAGRSSHLEIVKSVGRAGHNDSHGNRTVEGKEAFVTQVNLSPKSNRNLTFGASAWIGKLDVYQVEDIDEQIISVHLDYKLGSGEFLAELATVRHNYSDRAGNTNYAAYLQYNRRLELAGGRLSPYLRLDYLDIDEQDPVFSSLASQDRQSLGIRYDLNDNTALKLEVRRDRFSDIDQSANSLHGQLAIVF